MRRDGVWGNLQQMHYHFIQVYLKIPVNKVHTGLYIYQFYLCIGSLNLTMNTFPEYMRYFQLDLLALVCGDCCEFATLPLVSWVRCGT